MKNLYSMALEGRLEVERQAANPIQRTVVVTGPLSEQFTQELARQYAKVDPVTGTAQEPDVSRVATESQAQDVTIMQNLVANLSRQAEPSDDTVEQDPVTIHGVSEAELTPEDVIDVTSELAARENPREFVVIVQSDDQTSNANIETAPAEAVVEVEPAISERQAERKSTRAALESIVKKFGGSIYPSLEAFCKACEDGEGGVPDQSDPILPEDVAADPNAPTDLGDALTDPLADPVADSPDAPASADGADDLG